jgi:hypothetical protein
LLTASFSRAHDAWLQVNTNIARVGDAVHIDLMLGNHGNGHRDFKVAGKLDPSAGSLRVYAPDGKHYDLQDRLRDNGYAPREGFWSARFVGDQPGLHLVARLSDQIVTYAPKRSVQSAKTFFVLSASLDKVPPKNPGFDEPLGHPLELVLAGEVVSFIPRGETLSSEFDSRYERRTDAEGRAVFVPTEGNYYLIAAHKEDASERGQGYEMTKYSATLCLYVPQVLRWGTGTVI